MVEAATLRSQHHQPARARALGLDRRDTVKNGLTADQHPRTAAERAVVHFLMLIGRVVADVPQPHVDESALDRQLQQALLQIAVEDAGEEREDVETHSSDSVLMTKPNDGRSQNDEARMTNEALSSKLEFVFPSGLGH